MSFIIWLAARTTACSEVTFALLRNKIYKCLKHLMKAGFEHIHHNFVGRCTL